MEAAMMGELMASLGAMEQNPEMLMSFLDMMQNGGCGGGGGGFERYKNLDMLRDTEKKDVKFCLKNIRRACTHLGLEDTDGYIVDLGSGCGYLAAQYQHAFPKAVVVASDVTYVAETLKDQSGHPSMALLENTLKNLLEDHRKKLARPKKTHASGRKNFCIKKKKFGLAGFTRRASQSMRDRKERVENEAYVKTYTKMIDNFCEIDVLDAFPWKNVAHLEGQCKLVTCTMILHQKSFETPEMWKNIFLGAADLLMPGGVLFIFDGNVKNQGAASLEDLSDKSAITLFAEKCGLSLKTHRLIERGVVFLIVLEKKVAMSERPTSVQRKPVLATGDLVEIQGFIGKKEHNGCTGILGEFDTGKERWTVKVNAGVMAKRQVSQMLIKPENLRQLMPDIAIDKDLLAQIIDPVGAAMRKVGPLDFAPPESPLGVDGRQPFKFPEGSARQPGEQCPAFKFTSSSSDTSSPCKDIFSPSDTSTIDTPTKFSTDSAYVEQTMS